MNYIRYNEFWNLLVLHSSVGILLLRLIVNYGTLSRKDVAVSFRIEDLRSARLVIKGPGEQIGNPVSCYRG